MLAALPVCPGVAKAHANQTTSQCESHTCNTCEWVCVDSPIGQINAGHEICVIVQSALQMGHKKSCQVYELPSVFSQSCPAVFMMHLHFTFDADQFVSTMDGQAEVFMEVDCEIEP